MLLLYQPSDPLNADGGDHLHSTMLLLYRRAASSQNRSRRNLHSTMLLLYPPWWTNIFLLPWIYIPLCFYFIRDSHASGTDVPAFTFHYASTLSPAPQTGSCRNSNLHSTMLLLYPSEGAQAGPLTLYLHSTMLLLYLQSTSEITAEAPNLHSTMLLLYLRSYGQIRQGGVVFTFHYASTLSLTEYITSVWNADLHSTMLLLYPLDCPGAEPLKNNLHSTMLLLYLGPAFRACPLSVFTFHYASTLSIQKIYSFLDFFYLHSTMLLLYQRSGHGFRGWNIIYIPLCFYFIPGQRWGTG